MQCVGWFQHSSTHERIANAKIAKPAIAPSTMHSPTPRPARIPPARRAPATLATQTLVLLCGASLLMPLPALAENIAVTRKIADLYAVNGDNLLLLTNDCDVYALAAPAQLLSDSGRMVLRFNNSKDAAAKTAAAKASASKPATAAATSAATSTDCDLRDMVVPQQAPRGRFHVQLSYDSPDWYAIAGTNLLLRTVGCERRSGNEPAVWFQPMEGKGVIEYRSGLPCTSDGVFGSMRRQARSNSGAATVKR